MRWLIDALLSIPDMALTYVARHVPVDHADSRYAIRRINSPPLIRRYGYWPDVFSLLSILKQERPDVIYQRNGCAYTGICAWYVQNYGGRLVWHISIDNDLDPDIGRFPPVCRSLERRLRDHGIGRSDLIIAQTENQCRVLESRFQRRATIIRNFAQPVPPVVDKADSPTVVWVANLKPAKRPELYLEIFRKVSHDLGVKFVMVGRGGDRAPYSTLLAEIDPLEGFAYMGGRSLDETESLIEKAWILVNTSDVEGFPNTFLQAWLRNTVVVSLGIDPDGAMLKNGLGYVAGSTKQAATIIERLVQNPAERNASASRARAHVLKYHGLENARGLADAIVAEPASRATSISRKRR